MFFTNARPYRHHDDPEISLEALQQALGTMLSRPLGGSEGTRLGWTSPAGRKSDLLVHEVQGQRLLTALQQERKVPGSVLKAEVEERCADYERTNGQPPSRAQKRQFKEQAFEELLPRAFVVTKRIDVWWDTKRKLICINSSSSKQAEAALDLLRQTLGSLKVTPLATRTTPCRGMTGWLQDPEARPAWLTLGEKAVFQAGDQSSFVAKQADLGGEEVQTMLTSGHQAIQLTVTAENLATLTLTQELGLQGIRFAEALIKESHDNNDGDDEIARLEGDFILMAGALGELLDLVIEALDGEASMVTTTDNQDAA